METPSANRGPIKETVKKTIEFPEKDESVGELMISYMGPKSDQFLESKASCLFFLKKPMAIFTFFRGREQL